MTTTVGFTFLQFGFLARILLFYGALFKKFYSCANCELQLDEMIIHRPLSAYVETDSDQISETNKGQASLDINYTKAFNLTQQQAELAEAYQVLRCFSFPQQRREYSYADF